MDVTGAEQARGIVTAGYCRMMARYGAWQNRSQSATAETLADSERRRDQVAFWGSIHGTLSHLLWGDAIWMSRLADTPPPSVELADSARFVPGWAVYCAEREAMDTAIGDWAVGLGDADCAGQLTFHSAPLDRITTRPRAVCLMHFFNRQTHRRGQIHAMLTAAGAAPEATDLILMPDQQ